MAHDKNCHPFPIEPAPYAPGGECHPCRPDPCCPPRPPRPTPPPPPGCGPSQYVGARYVPKFADPIEWDTERGYESLTIVTYKGESYTSKCPVPPGIDIKNTRYWALTGAYNAQVEEYKNQVKDLSQQVTGFASDNKEFREKITQYEKDNAEMKNSVASTVARVDALAERVDNADAAISDLQAGQAQTVKDIAALEAKDADLQRQISSNDTDISAIQAKDREQDARLSAIETVNDAQAATLTQNTQDIARNTENIQDNAASIAVNSKELAKHAEQLKDHAAQLTVLHKEVTDNHTAIERLTSVTDGLRADLTEDEAKIAQNADAIAHIQQKDVQQDGRLDALENRTTAAEGRLDALDTKTDATNAALTAERPAQRRQSWQTGSLSPPTLRSWPGTLMSCPTMSAVSLPLRLRPTVTPSPSQTSKPRTPPLILPLPPLTTRWSTLNSSTRRNTQKPLRVSTPKTRHRIARLRPSKPQAPTM